MQYKLSILIPARNEEFLVNTVQDLLKNKTEDTEILVGLDGALANPPIPDHPDVKVLYYSESIGQRGMTRQLCKLSRAKYIAKTDAHCVFDKHFDKKMFEAFEKAGDSSVIIPVMRNLWMFDWKCFDCGYKQYQGPKPEKCENCNGTNIKKKMMLIAKKSPQSVSYCFDSEPHFQYFKEYAKRPEYKKDLEETNLTKTMSIQGSFFMMTRKKYWDLDIDDEAFGSWGSQGICVSMKFWLSGGQVLINHQTWYSHMFRTQGKDFSFPYPQSGRQVQNAKKYAKDLFFNNKWPLQIHSLSWVLDKFKPINGWTEKEIEEQREREKNHPKFSVNVIKKSTSESKSLAKEVEISKGIIFYTDNKLKLSIAHAVQDQLRSIELPIVSASLKPMPHFGKNVYLPLKRGQLTMFKQILAALEASTADVIFHCENDCLYPKEHFNFTPPRKDTFYYNLNVIKIDANDGKTLKVDVCRQVSGLCAYRELLVSEYRRRVEIVERDGYKGNSGYEPGTKCIKSGGYSDTGREDWNSEVPILDIRHDNNLTKNRFKKEQFRNQSNTVGWTEGNYEDIKGWDVEIIRKIIKN
jgi:hypothetical protein